MGKVVVGYVPKPEGEAALAQAIAEAQLRGSDLVVVNSHRGGAGFDSVASAQLDADMDKVRAKVEAAGVAFEIVRGGRMAH